MTADSDGVARGRMRVLGYAEPEAEFQLLRALGVANYGGASVGELLVAADTVRADITAQPSESRDTAACWVQAHGRLAQRVEAQARAAIEKGHLISARDHFFRASMYYRSAEYFCDPYTPDHQKWGLSSRECFIEGARQLGTPFDVLRIPFEIADIPAYFFQPAGADGSPRKTVIVHTGFDGSSEELYFQCGRAALERGYNVLAIDGPGQTGMTRLHPELKFRPDWEAPLKVVVDWLATQPCVDMDRLGLYGISLGGYFALRAACFEPRIRALALNSPILDLKAYQLGFFPREVVDDPPEVRREWLPEIPRSDLPDHLRVLLKLAFFRFGVESVHEWLQFLDAFQTGQFIGQLKIPCLSMVGEAEGAEPLHQARTFCEGAGGTVSEYVFIYDEGADGHCQLANLPLSSAVLYDWMDEQFNTRQY